MARFEAAALWLAALSACAIPSRGELTRGRGADAGLPDGEAPSAVDGEAPTAADGDVPAAPDGDVPAAPDGEAPSASDGELPAAPDAGAFDPCADHARVELSLAEPDLDASLCWIDLSGGATLAPYQDDAGAGMLAQTPQLAADAEARARGAVVLWTAGASRPFPNHVRVRVTVSLFVPEPRAIADHIEWLKLQADVADDALIPGVGLLLWSEGHKTAGLVVDNIDTPGEQPSADNLTFREFQTAPADAYTLDLDVRFGDPGSISLSVNGADVPDVTGSYTVEASPRARRLFLLLGLDAHGSAASGVVYRDLVVDVE